MKKRLCGEASARALPFLCELLLAVALITELHLGYTAAVCMVVMPVAGHLAHWLGYLILTHSLTTLELHHFGLAYKSGSCLTLFSPALLFSLRTVGLLPSGEGRWALATTIPAFLEQPKLALTESPWHVVLCCSHRKEGDFSSQSSQSFCQTPLPKSLHLLAFVPFVSETLSIEGEKQEFERDSLAAQERQTFDLAPANQSGQTLAKSHHRESVALHL